VMAVGIKHMASVLQDGCLYQICCRKMDIVQHNNGTVPQPWSQTLK